MVLYRDSKTREGFKKERMNNSDRATEWANEMIQCCLDLVPLARVGRLDS